MELVLKQKEKSNDNNCRRLQFYSTGNEGISERKVLVSTKSVHGGYLQEVATKLSKYPVRYVFLGVDRVCNEWGRTELRRLIQRYRNTLFFILTEVRCTPINRLLVMTDNLIIINRRDLRPVLARIKAGLLYLNHNKRQLRLSDTFCVSTKETRILSLFFHGISHGVICNKLSIGNKTLYSHLWNVKRRTHLASMQQLYQIYQIKQIIP